MGLFCASDAPLHGAPAIVVVRLLGNAFATIMFWSQMAICIYVLPGIGSLHILRLPSFSIFNARADVALHERVHKVGPLRMGEAVAAQ